MNRPFTFINSAMSADGKISTWQRKQVRISGALDFDRVDELRATSDDVMVGIGTVLADDPSLTVKSAQRKAERTWPSRRPSTSRRAGWTRPAWARRAGWTTPAAATSSSARAPCRTACRCAA